MSLERCRLEPFIRKFVFIRYRPYCIYTIESSEELFPDASMAQRMEEWGRSHGLVPEGILYSNNMSSFLGEETNIYYLELYMPVVQSGYHR